jgi:hypothetical protein
MPLTREGRKVKRAMVKQYGAKKGEEGFYATMTKYDKKWHRSPDVYDDTALGETPPKREYHAEQENVHAREGKRAGGTPAGAQQNSGTESPRVETETRMAAAKSTPSGGARRWPSGVDRFNDSGV